MHMLQFGPKKPSEQAGNVHSYKHTVEHTVLGLNISKKTFYISFAEFKE